MFNTAKLAKIYTPAKSLKLSAALLGAASLLRFTASAETDGDGTGAKSVSMVPYAEPPKPTNVLINAEVRPVLASDLLPGHQRLRDVDNAMVMPLHRSIRLSFGSNDVIHSWFLPGIHLKFDCIPGRTQSRTIFFYEPGIYYGVCAELCGSMHARMPFCVRVVHEDDMV